MREPLQEITIEISSSHYDYVDRQPPLSHIFVLPVPPTDDYTDILDRLECCTRGIRI